MGALDKFKKKNSKAGNDEVKIVKVDIDNVLNSNLKDDRWDIATRENQEKIAALEMQKQEEALEAEKETINTLEDEDDFEYHMEDRKYVVDGYGIISDLPDSVLGNVLELIKVLENARDREQWLYILDNAKSEAFDITLIDYLFEHNYTLDEYKCNVCAPNSVVKNQTSIFYRFLKEFLMNNDTDNLDKLLSLVSFIDDRIIEIIVNNKDRNKIIRDNYLLRFDEDKKLFYALLDYEAKREKKDFSYLDSMTLNNLNQTDIENLLNAGYEIDANSPDIILNNNEIIRKKFLHDYDKDIINLLLTKANNKEGFSWQLYNINNKQVLTKYFMKTMGMRDFLNVIKYIELEGININLDKAIETEHIEFIKKLYKELNSRKKFNRQLFIDLINLYETNTDLIVELSSLDNIDDYIYYIQLLLSMKDKSYINTIEKLENIEEYIYNNQVNEIENNKDILLLKDFICYDLIGVHYLDVHKMLVELLSSNKLKNLRLSFKNENSKKSVDKFINLSLFLERLVDCDNVSVLKNVAVTVSECVYKTKIWVRDIDSLRREVMSLYVNEINEKMIDFNRYMTNKSFTVDGKTVGLVNINSGEEFNLFIEKIPYYGNNDNLLNVKSNKFIDDNYRSLCGISDELGNITFNKDEVVVLYNKLYDDSLYLMANRELGINYEKKNDVMTQMNAMPFRTLVRNTKQLINTACNEYIVDKELVEPSGILIVDIPTKEQIDASVYLGVPLVNIEDLSLNAFRTSKGIININYCNYKEEDIVEEEITHDNNNDQFLELFGSLLEIKGEEENLLVADYTDNMYVVKENDVLRRVLPLFRESEDSLDKIDVDEVRRDKIKSDIFKVLFSDASINYEIKKVIVDDEAVLSAVFDMVEDEEQDISNYDITDYLKKMAVSYLLGDPYDADSYRIKQDWMSRSQQLFEEILLTSEYEEEMQEIRDACNDGIVNIDFIKLIDFIDKIEKMDDGEYLCIFKYFIDVNNKVSSNSLIEALLRKKNSLVKEMGKVIEYFSTDENKE